MLKVVIGSVSRHSHVRFKCDIFLKIIGQGNAFAKRNYFIKSVFVGASGFTCLN